MKTLVEGQFGHGAIHKKIDVRDHKIKGLAKASVPFDWINGFDIEAKLGYSIPTEDQGQSSSCGGQADRYYLGVLEALEKGNYQRLSAKDSYCQIFYPGGGTTIRDIGRISVIKNRGVRSEALVPSYQNGQAPSEAFMEDRSISNIAPLIFFRPQAYAFSKTDIESIAESIRDNNGCIIMIGGENNGTWLSSFPKVPKSVQWRHFLYAGKAKIINGIKYIGVKNSWGDNVGVHGWQWLSEDYFKKAVFDAMVYYDPVASPYIPSTTQITLTWFQQIIQWFSKYLH